MRNRIESILRILAYIAVLITCGTVAYRNLVPAGVRSSATSLVGQHVSVTKAGSRDAKYTLMFVLSTHCTYCAASAPFYRHLVGDFLPQFNGRIQTVARLGGDVNESKEYLEHRLGVKMDTVEAVAVPGVTATPTLLLIDGNGRVELSWVGMIPEPQERDVIARISSVVNRGKL